MAAFAASPASAVSPKAALLAGAAPEAAQAAPTLDAMFANLLSKSTEANTQTRSQLPAGTTKSQSAKQKTDPANAALMALMQGQATAAPQATPATVPDSASTQPVVSAQKAGSAKAQTPAIQPVTPDAGKNSPAADAADPNAAIKTAQDGKPQPVTAQNGKPDPQTAKNASDPLAALKNTVPGNATSKPQQPPAATDTASADDSKKSASSDLQALSAASAHLAAPDKQVTQAKALPVQFDLVSGKAGAKADARDDSASDHSGKDDRLADAQPQNDSRPIASAPQTRTDAPAQNTHSGNQQQNIAPAQPQAANQNASATSGNASATATAAASATAQSATSQNNAPALQVVPQAQTAAGAVSPDLSALAVSIAAKSKNGEKQFDIRLDPPDLGRVDVRLSVDASGKAQAHLVADKPQTLDLLQRDRSDLERSLKDAGLALSNNGLNFSLKGQERQGDGAPAQTGGSALGLAAVASDEAAPSAATNINGLSMGRSRLDIRV